MVIDAKIQICKLCKNSTIVRGAARKIFRGDFQFLEALVNCLTSKAKNWRNEVQQEEVCINGLE